MKHLGCENFEIRSNSRHLIKNCLLWLFESRSESNRQVRLEDRHVGRRMCCWRCSGWPWAKRGGVWVTSPFIASETKPVLAPKRVNQEFFKILHDSVFSSFWAFGHQVTKYEEAVRSSWVWEELSRVRNFKPATLLKKKSMFFSNWDMDFSFFQLWLRYSRESVHAACTLTISLLMLLHSFRREG